MSSSLVPLQAIPVSTSNRVVVTGPCILLKTTTVAQQVRALRPIKKQEPSDGTTTEPEFLRCKRRADFSKLGLNLPKVHPVASSRRNARERNRVKQVNNGFDTLRQRVPNGKKNKKMSKVDTLRAAVEYIKNLQELLEQNNCTPMQCDGIITNNENDYSTGIPTVPQTSLVSSSPSTTYSSSSSSSSTSSFVSVPSSQSYHSMLIPTDNRQSDNNIIHSPGPSECSDSCESSVSSFEERDLSEFSTWIDALCGVNLS